MPAFIEKPAREALQRALDEVHAMGIRSGDLYAYAVALDLQQAAQGSDISTGELIEALEDDDSLSHTWAELGGTVVRMVREFKL